MQERVDSNHRVRVSKTRALGLFATPLFVSDVDPVDATLKLSYLCV